MNPSPRPPNPPPPAPGDVAPGHALNWLAEGWRLFMKAPGPWVIQALIFFVIIAALGMLPFLGWAAAPVALPVLVAGMLSGAQALDRGEPLRIDALFDGIRRHAGNLLLVGAFHLLGLLLAAMVAAAIGGSAALTGMAVGAMAGMGMAAGGMMLGVVAFTVLWALVMMAMWFAPALVMLHEVAPLDAMKLSVRACVHNLLAFIVLAALLYVGVWVAMIPAGLGMLVLIPVIAGALYAAWKETFSPLLALPKPDLAPAAPVAEPAPEEPGPLAPPTLAADSTTAADNPAEPDTPPAPDATPKP